MVQTNEQYRFVHQALCLYERELPDCPPGGEWWKHTCWGPSIAFITQALVPVWCYRGLGQTISRVTWSEGTVAYKRLRGVIAGTCLQLLIWMFLVQSHRFVLLLCNSVTPHLYMGGVCTDFLNLLIAVIFVMFRQWRMFKNQFPWVCY